MASAPEAKAQSKCIIDVFGEIYNLGTDKSAIFAYAGRDAFLKAWPAGAEQLLCHYFPYKAPRPEIASGDVADLIRIFEYRLAQLKHAELYSPYLVNMAKRRTYAEMTLALQELKAKPTVPVGAVGKGPVAPAAAAPKAQPTTFTPAEQYLALVNFAWHLLHPDQGWDATLAAVKQEISRNSSISGLVENIKRADSARGVGADAVPPMNYFTRLESLAPVTDALTLQAAYTAAKDAAIADARRQQLKDLEIKLSAVTAVLSAHGYETDPTKLDAALVDKIGHTFDPVIAYLRKLYDPVFPLLERIVAEYDPEFKETRAIPTMPLMDIIQAAMDAPEGVTAFQPDPSITNFIDYVMNKIDQHLAGADSAKRAAFYEQLAALPTGKVDTGATVLGATGSPTVTGIFPRSELTVIPWKAFNKADQSGYKALVKAGIDATEINAAYLTIANIIGPESSRNLFIISGKKGDFPEGVKHTFVYNKKNVTIKVSDILLTVDNYFNTAMLSMLVLILFRTRIPGGKEALLADVTKWKEREMKAAVDVPNRVEGAVKGSETIRKATKAALAAVKPVPAAVKPVPAAVKPVPAAVKPVPAAVKPVPAAVKPVPAAVKPEAAAKPIKTLRFSTVGKTQPSGAKTAVRPKPAIATATASAAAQTPAPK